MGIIAFYFMVAFLTFIVMGVTVDPQGAHVALDAAEAFWWPLLCLKWLGIGLYHIILG